MKVKLKMDSKTIREFFVQHVEKIVFAGVVVCFVVIVYAATALETLETTPEELTALADDARHAWVGVEPIPGNYDAPDFEGAVKRSQEAIKEGDYPFDRFNRPIIEPRRQRGEPRLYAVEELRGTADSGRLSMVPNVEEEFDSPPGSGATVPRQAYMGSQVVPRGQRWVVLTGLVPIEEQFREYHEYFKTAQTRGSADVPSYMGYVVQRAEVKSSDAREPLDWSETFYSTTAQEEANKMFGQSARMGQDVVDPRFLDKEGRLCTALPPLLDREWDESVVHEPDIPLYRRQFEPQELPGEASPEPGEAPDPFAVRDRSGRYYGHPGSQYGPTMGEFDGAAGGFSVPGQAGRLPSAYLFRFFDFKVEPGKRYRYRVSLVLMNPNLGVDDQYLSPEVLDKKQQLEQDEKLRAAGKPSQANSIPNHSILKQWKYVESDWTDPTDVISVPRDSRLLALSVRPPTRIGAEPLGKVMVISWVEEKGIEAFSEKSVSRGKVANFPDCRFPEKKRETRPKGSTRGALREDVPIPGMGQGPEAGIDDTSVVHYLTDTLVLDMHGGELVPGKDRLPEPGAMLLMDPEGTLVVRHELDDLVESNEFQETLLTDPMFQEGYQPGGHEYDRREFDAGEYDGYQYEGNLGGLRSRRGRTSPGGWPRRGAVD